MGFALFVSAFGHHVVSSADEVPTITVVVQYPGASADTIAVLVAAPLERQFSAIAGVTSITSMTTDGSTKLTLELDQRTLDATAPDVRSAISAVSASLPQDLPTPAIVTRGRDR